MLAKAFDGLRARTALGTLCASPTFARLTSGLQAAGEGMAELLWPTRCVLCDVPGTLLCHECSLEIPYIEPLRACPYCGQAHGRHACIDCNSFMVKHRGLTSEGLAHEGQPLEDLAPEGRSPEDHALEGQPLVGRLPLDQVASVFQFVDPCRKLITTYKDRREIRLAQTLAELLAPYVNPAWIAPGSTALVVIPARKQALRERGFDHMQRIGECLAKLTGLPLLDLIEPQERGDQRGLSAANRQHNMQNSFVPKYPQEWGCFTNSAAQPYPEEWVTFTSEAAQAHSEVQDRPTLVQHPKLPTTVILVDDVLTTGATLNAAATTLKEMGIHQVFGLTLARIP